MCLLMDAIMSGELTAIYFAILDRNCDCPIYVNNPQLILMLLASIFLKTQTKS